MRRPATVDRERLRSAFESEREWIDLAAERADWMAASAEARDDGRYSGETTRSGREGTREEL
ncbi:MAG: hypothetical protein RI560_04170 [Natronomonas sp.]|uniref:hypothetical protein n=1 Tax=Natronomonas sp. TaxID=2184060 RepID=UPI002870ACF6|nr:hypothetical protein [Natronomonas sp.]MDR9380852.1 hypothetical protein [Natronomonas sp.]MDR9430090.1 hypothetical protein [Natronomonas sp.]